MKQQFLSKIAVLEKLFFCRLIKKIDFFWRFDQWSTSISDVKIIKFSKIDFFFKSTSLLPGVVNSTTPTRLRTIDQKKEEETGFEYAAPVGHYDRALRRGIPPASSRTAF